MGSNVEYVNYNAFKKFVGQMEKTVKEIVSHYQLEPHPEGGFFRETYRSDITYETPSGKRVASTAIIFLITKDSISHFHRLTADECWHFYGGSPLRLLQISPEGNLKETKIGADIFNGEKLQHIVPSGDWFASTSYGEYSLVGCTVAPGFEFDDFEMGKKKVLIDQFPQHREILEDFCLD